MQACREIVEDESDLRDDVIHYRAILRQRTRYYLAQRDAGVPAAGAAVLDLLILGNLEGCFMDVDSVAEVLGLARSAARERVVELIRAGWVEVRHGETGAGLYATEKAASFAENWIGIASAA